MLSESCNTLQLVIRSWTFGMRRLWLWHASLFAVLWLLPASSMVRILVLLVLDILLLPLSISYELCYSTVMNLLSVRAVQRWPWWSYHLWSSLVQELPVSHLVIWRQLLAEDLSRRVCNYLVSAVLHQSWKVAWCFLRSSDTAQDWAQDISVLYFPQCYHGVDEINALLPELYKITSVMKIGEWFISVAERTDFLIRSKLYSNLQIISQAFTLCIFHISNFSYSTQPFDRFLTHSLETLLNLSEAKGHPHLIQLNPNPFWEQHSPHGIAVRTDWKRLWKQMVQWAVFDL